MKRTTVLVETAVFGIAALLALTLIGCPDPNSGSEDSWEKVTALDELTGTSWEGTVNVSIPDQDEYPATSVSGTISVTVTEDTFTKKIDMDIKELLTDYFGVIGRDSMWEFISSAYQIPGDAVDPEAEYTINYECTDKYHVKVNFEAPIPENGLSVYRKRRPVRAVG
jgi:hypothetical protein